MERRIKENSLEYLVSYFNTRILASNHPKVDIYEEMSCYVMISFSFLVFWNSLDMTLCISFFVGSHSLYIEAITQYFNLNWDDWFSFWWEIMKIVNAPHNFNHVLKFSIEHSFYNSF